MEPGGTVLMDSPASVGVPRFYLTPVRNVCTISSMEPQHTTHIIRKDRTFLTVDGDWIEDTYTTDLRLDPRLVAAEGVMWAWYLARQHGAEPVEVELVVK